MKTKVLSYKKEPSKYGGDCFVVFFKAEDGRSARTWLYPNNGNFKRWKPLLELLDRRKADEETYLDGLRYIGKNLVDADSLFQFVTA